MTHQLPVDRDGIPKTQLRIDTEAQFVDHLRQRGMTGVPRLDNLMHPADGKLAGWQYQLKFDSDGRPSGLLRSPHHGLESWLPSPPMTEGEIVPHWLPSSWYRFDDLFEVAKAHQPLLLNVTGLSSRGREGSIKARMRAAPTALRWSLPHEFGAIARLRLNIQILDGGWSVDLVFPLSHGGFRLPPCGLWTDRAVLLHLRREKVLHQAAASGAHYRVLAIESGTNVAVRMA